MPTLTVHAIWDAEAEVWVATSEDVPGLATEAANPSELIQKLQTMIPELLRLNGVGNDDNDIPEVPVSLLYEQNLTVRI